MAAGGKDESLTSSRAWRAHVSARISFVIIRVLRGQKKPLTTKGTKVHEGKAYWYGIIRFTLRRSPGLTSVPLPSLRLRFLSFEVRMWRRCECPRFTFPVAVFLKRFDAPLCVFNFGISPQNRLSAFGVQLSALNIQTDF